MKDYLSKIRPPADAGLTQRQRLARILLAGAAGAALGFLAKYLDSTTVAGDIGTYLGFWVLTTTILAAWSRSPAAAAAHASAFLWAMLASYYIYSMVLFGFFPRYYFLAWGSVALLAPAGAYGVWYARGDGWLAALGAALPIGVLLYEGYPFYYAPSPPRGFALAAAGLLFLILPRSMPQRGRVLPWTAAVFLALWRFNLLQYLPW
jgi:hypothetical protein